MPLFFTQLYEPSRIRSSYHIPLLASEYMSMHAYSHGGGIFEIFARVLLGKWPGGTGTPLKTIFHLQEIFHPNHFQTSRDISVKIIFLLKGQCISNRP